MLFRGIKHQVDKGPVDWVTGKAKYTLNDNRLLREDMEYRPLVRAPCCSPRPPHPLLWSPDVLRGCLLPLAKGPGFPACGFPLAELLAKSELLYAGSCSLGPPSSPSL